MVGGGIKSAENMQKLEKDLIPNGVDWIKKKAIKFKPDENIVELENGKQVC